MPDWEQFVRRNLRLTRVSPQRENEIIQELAEQLDEAYNEALSRDCLPDEAARFAQDQIKNWNELAEQLASSHSGVPLLEYWQERVDSAESKQRWRSFFADIEQDLLFGLRMLRKWPGFTAVVLLTLALGIGANTAIFSMTEALLLRPLPFPHADQLVMVWEDVHLPHYENSQNTPAPGNFADWRTQNTVFSGMAAIGYRSWNLSADGEPQRIEGEAYSSDIFAVLETYPILGRAFTAEEDRPGAGRVALLGYGLWKSRFGGDSGIIGRSILLDEQSYTVIGVMPQNFAFPDPDDQLYVPLGLTDQQLANHGSHFLRVVARLKPGVEVSRAQSEMEAIARRLTEQHPDSNTGVGASVISLHEQFVGNMRRPLLVLSGVVGVVMLMVCANVASLLLARGSIRQKELAVRAALGANRSRIVRQLLVESILVSALGGILGLILAFLGIHALRWYAPAAQYLAEARMNATVCAFNLGVSVVVGFIFGLVPAFQSSRREVVSVLKDGSRESPSGGLLRTRGLLVVFETALGMIVLVAAGLLLRSFARLQAVPLGFETDRALTVRVILRGPRYDTLEKRVAFHQQAFQRIQALPGVRAVAGISFLPLTFAGRTTGLTIEGQDAALPGQLPFADFRAVSPGYFAAIGIPFIKGRDFSWADTPNSPLCVIVSETMAHSFWPNDDALGKRIKLGSPGEKVPWITVVGVVGNARQLDLTGQPRPAMYLPISQDAGTGDILREWIIRTSGDPVNLAAAIRGVVWTLDPNLPISRVRTMEQIRSTFLGPQEFNLVLVGLFGVLALLLAAVGLYGVTSYSVAQRTREIGVRMALGATPGGVLRLIVGQGAGLALLGLAIGTAAALALTSLMASLLYGISSHDPLTFVVVVLVLLFTALTACYLPARSAMQVDPTIALRQE